MTEEQDVVAGQGRGSGRCGSVATLLVVALAGLGLGVGSTAAAAAPLVASAAPATVRIVAAGPSGGSMGLVRDCDGTYRASEAGQELEVSRTGPTSAPLTVGLEASGLTAGVDYVALPETITIPAGRASVRVPVTFTPPGPYPYPLPVLTVAAVAGPGYVPGPPAEFVYELDLLCNTEGRAIEVGVGEPVVVELARGQDFGATIDVGPVPPGLQVGPGGTVTGALTSPGTYLIPFHEYVTLPFSGEVITLQRASLTIVVTGGPGTTSPPPTTGPAPVRPGAMTIFPPSSTTTIPSASTPTVDPAATTTSSTTTATSTTPTAPAGPGATPPTVGPAAPPLAVDPQVAADAAGARRPHASGAGAVLARTGAPLSGPVALGAGLVVLGTVLVAGSRSRRRVRAT